MKHIFPFKNYVVFDFETTGLKDQEDQEDQVIQMAAIKKKNGVWMEPFNRFIKISTPLPQLIIDLTQITDTMLEKEGIESKIAWSQFNDYIENMPLVGHNIVNFDCKFLERFFKEHELTHPDRRRYVDTAMLYKALKMPSQPFWYETHYDFAKRVGGTIIKGLRFKLTICCEELGIDISKIQAHRADGDIEMTNLIYEHFLEKL